VRADPAVAPPNRDRSSALGQVSATDLALGEPKHELLSLVRKLYMQLRRFYCRNCEPPIASSTSLNKTLNRFRRKLPHPMHFSIDRPNAMLSGCRA
jgi:hypothetical protein